MLDIEAVADMLGCTVSGVRKVVARGEIRYFQHGKRGRLKFKPEWVEEFIDRNTTGLSDAPAKRITSKRAAKHKTEACDEAVCGFGWDLLKQ